jgi:dUTP pyrophosphatase
MFISNTSKLTIDSNVYVKVECDSKCIETCENIVEDKYNNIMNNIKKNGGSYICTKCSHHMRFTKIIDLVDNEYFNKIDNIEKAYLFGLLIYNIQHFNINDGYISFLIPNFSSKNIEHLLNFIGYNIFINNKNNLTFIIKNDNINDNICKHLNIDIKNLNNILNNNNIKYISLIYFLDNLKNIELQLAFIRAYFEVNGTLLIDNCNENGNDNKINCNISSYSKDNLLKIANILNIPFIFDKKLNNSFIYYNDGNIIDMLGLIYKNSEGLRLDKYYNIYINILNNSYKLPLCKILKVDDNAIIPSKTRESDVGYDLTIIKEVRKFNKTTTLYDTGIKIYVQSGYYIEVVPRSSLSKSGYILANSIGIIDQTYRGNILVALSKIDEESNDIQLPFKCCQLIFRKQIHTNMIEVIDNFEETNRNTGGYGSTSKS